MLKPKTIGYRQSFNFDQLLTAMRCAVHIALVVEKNYNFRCFKTVVKNQGAQTVLN
jgi:hypothetical protein